MQGVEALEGYFARYLPQVILASLVPPLVIAWVAFVDLEATLIMLFTLPLVPVFMWLIGRYTEQRTQERWQALQQLSTHFLDIVRGLPTLRAFGRAEAQASTIDAVSERYRKTTMETLRVSFLSGSVLELAATLGVALVAVATGLRLVSGSLGLQAGLTVLILAPELYLPFRRLGAEYHASADGLAVAERMFELLDAPSAVPSGGRRLAPSPALAAVRFEAVSFSYPGREGLVLDGMELELPPKQTVALVGQSGAGKSTVAALLLGLLVPTAGRITAGGIDLATCQLEAWRAHTAWVPQHPTLFRGTVAENIRLAAPATGDAQVRRAAAQAGADEFIRALPSGYDTVVGDGGRTLSPGRAPAHRAGPRVPEGSSAGRARRADGRSGPPQCRRRLGRRGAVAGAALRAADRSPPRAGSARGPGACPDRRSGGWRAAPERGVSATLPALFRLAPAPRTRLALAVVLGALTVLFGVGLMAAAGYLISRAAERPAVLSLMVAIVAVRFFGLGRPVVRYLERLVSHDVALRVLARVRTSFYVRIEPLAPTQLDGYRRGDLLSRMVADVDALQNLYLRGVGPPLVALLAGAVSVGTAAAFVPAAGLVLAVGLLAGAVVVPALGGLAARRAGQAQAPVRGELTAEVVELVRGAPELVAFGGEQMRLDRARRADRALVRLARRDALAGGAADGLGMIVTGLTVAGVLAVAVGAAGDGRLDRVLIAMLALLALASFEAVTPLAGAARELSRTLAAGRRVLELTDQAPAVGDPVDPIAAPVWPFAVELQDVVARYPGQPRAALHGVGLRLEAGEHVALGGGQRGGEDDGHQPAPALPRPRIRPGDDRRPRSSPLPARGRPARDRGRRPGLPRVHGQHPRQRPPGQAGGERLGDRAGIAPSPNLGLGIRTPGWARTRWSARRDRRCQAGSGSGSCSHERCWPERRCWCSMSRRRTWTRARRASSSKTSSPPRTTRPCC